MRYDDRTELFERLLLPHLDAAHNLARWLIRDPAGAQDVVQDSYLRALAQVHRFSGENARAWVLTIVRNQCYTWLKRARGHAFVDIDDADGLGDADRAALGHDSTPERLLIRARDEKILGEALERVPPLFREALVLRELEDLSYKEIAAVTGVAIGTVMSRIARARAALRKELAAHAD